MRTHARWAESPSTQSPPTGAREMRAATVLPCAARICHCPGMCLETWANWWRSRRALALLASTMVLWFSSSMLSARGQCEHILYEDGILLPSNYPWTPSTHAGREATAFLISVTNVVAPVLDGVLLVVLVALLWTRLLPSARWGLVPALVPLLGTAMTIAAYVGFYAGNAVSGLAPDVVVRLGERTWLINERARSVFLAATVLVGIGAVGLLFRTISARLRRSRVAT